MNGFAAISTNAVAYPENLSDKYCVPSAVFNPDRETTFCPFSNTIVLCGRAISKFLTKSCSLFPNKEILLGSKYTLDFCLNDNPVIFTAAIPTHAFPTINACLKLDI